MKTHSQEHQGIYELMAETAEMEQRAMVELAAVSLAERPVEATPHSEVAQVEEVVVVLYWVELEGVAPSQRMGSVQEEDVQQEHVLVKREG